MSQDTDVTYYLSNLTGKSLLSDVSFKHILNNKETLSIRYASGYVVYFNILPLILC